jgi:hypothetical protein
MEIYELSKSKTATALLLCFVVIYQKEREKIETQLFHKMKHSFLQNGTIFLRLCHCCTVVEHFIQNPMIVGSNQGPVS